ncbi:MAG: M6 family metalloprotease domain-containing protein, partial [Bacteroidales bacterium]
MKKLSLLFLIAQLSFLQEEVKAVTAYPYPIEFTQPDGSIITVLLKGDEKVHWALTSDGYTLMFNSSGTYEYAMLNDDNEMVPSGIKANNIANRSSDELIFLTQTPKALFYSKSQISVMKQIWDVYNNAAKGAKGFPTTGTRKYLLILANFNNTSTTYTQAQFNNYMNQVNYNSTGSFRDYYLENSYGQLTVNTTVTVWVTVPNTHDYYGPDTKWGEFAYEAVKAANPTVDYSQYDNDGDGIVDGVAIIHQGRGQEESGNVNDIWSHSWDLASAGYNATQRTFDGVRVYSYTANPEKNSSGIVTIGVMCHEFGHTLGAPDFYDTDYGTGG